MNAALAEMTKKGYTAPQSVQGDSDLKKMKRLAAVIMSEKGWEDKIPEEESDAVVGFLKPGASKRRTLRRRRLRRLLFTVSRRWMRSSPICGTPPKRLNSRPTSALIALLGPTKVRTTSWWRKGLESHQRSAEARVRFPVTVPQRWIHLGLHAVSRRGSR